MSSPAPFVGETLPSPWPTLRAVAKKSKALARSLIKRTPARLLGYINAPDEKTAIEEAAEISNAYFEILQRDAERRLVRSLRSVGGKIHQMTKEDFLMWLQLAQRTAWMEYTKTNPRAQELLLGAVQRLLERFGSKDDVIDTLYSNDMK